MKLKQIKECECFRRKGLHHLTYWSFLVGEKQGAVISIHVCNADVVTISPIKLPGEEGKERSKIVRNTETL